MSHHKGWWLTKFFHNPFWNIYSAIKNDDFKFCNNMKKHLKSVKKWDTEFIYGTSMFASALIYK